ncbi:hypothetical protein HC024_21485 [Methylococcaceae bacterium WWC4]|nr:hypothetical protein [Methylococcaceae bacterium WWC4]
MAEATQIMFTHREVVTALLKSQNIHEGIWALSVQFGMGAANIASNEDGEELNPAAIIPVLKIGLNRVDKINNLSVDASQANPE